MSKLPHVGNTIFSTMSALANEHKAINLSQGFPNFPVDEDLITELKHQSDQEVHQYMPMAGFPGLMAQVAELVEDQYGRRIATNQELLITAGATQAIFTTILALVEQGDEVIILDPSYDCYEPAIILAGGIPARIPLGADFLPDWDRIADAISSKTRLLITNNPHNPSGRVWSAEDLTALERIVSKNEQLLILSDEVYEFITFKAGHRSVHASELLRDRAIVISSFGKTFHITGWKMGYVVAPEHLMNEIKKVHQFNVFSVNSVAQATLANYLKKVDVGLLGSFYQDKRDLFASLLEQSRFKLLSCEGTYFQAADYSDISTEGDVDFCKRLTTEFGVAAIPISVFNANQQDRKIIRFCFAKDEQTIIQATERLCKI